MARSTVDAAAGQLIRQVPGASIAAVATDGSITTSAAGKRDLSSGAAATLGTAYLWFSMTKIVTATAVMQLRDRGTLSLDDPVQRFLPEFPEPRGDWPEVRIRHLLSHSAGLSNPLPVRWVHREQEEGRDPREFALELLRKNKKLRFPAGSKAVYSNLGYITLGEVISAASGQRFEDYVEALILKPLSMTRSGFSFSGLEDDAAVGYQRRLHPMTPLFRLILPRGIFGERAGRYVSFNRFLVDGPAYGGLVGSATDAARFMACHLRGGELDGVRLLSPESTREMQKIQATGRKLDVGFGWFRRSSNRSDEENFVEHLGGGGGYWNMMRIYPERGVGVVCMGNATAYDHGAVARVAIGVKS